jgi:hypothetical protein
MASAIFSALFFCEAVSFEAGFFEVFLSDAFAIICALYVTIYAAMYCPSRESQFCETTSKPQNLTA